VRVGLDGRPLQPGFRGHAGRGYGRYAHSLVAALARAGEAELILYFDPRLPVPEEQVPAGVSRRFYPRGPLRVHHTLQTHTLVAAAVERAPVDVFHFLVHMDAARCRARPVVITLHDLIPFILWNLYERGRPIAHRVARALERRAIEGAALLLANSETTRRDVLRLMRVPAERVRVAHHALDPQFRPVPAEEAAGARARYGLGRPYVIYLGGVDRHKNVEALLEAYARLRSRSATPPDLVLIGNVVSQPGFVGLRRAAERLRLGDSLRLIGFVPDEDLPALLGAAELLAHPSLYEGFGLTPLEALACGTAVAGFAAGALPEVLGEAALLVPPGDVTALAGAMERLLGDRGLRAALVERGRERVARLTWEATARETIAGYRDAVAARAEPRRVRAAGRR